MRTLVRPRRSVEPFFDSGLAYLSSNLGPIGPKAYGQLRRSGSIPGGNRRWSSRIDVSGFV